MPQSRPQEGNESNHDLDNWEVRAVAVVARLDAAANELRVLIDQIRLNRGERTE